MHDVHVAYAEVKGIKINTSTTGGGLSRSRNSKKGSVNRRVSGKLGRIGIGRPEWKRLTFTRGSPGIFLCR